MASKDKKKFTKKTLKDLLGYFSASGMFSDLNWADFGSIMHDDPEVYGEYSSCKTARGKGASIQEAVSQEHKD